MRPAVYFIVQFMQDHPCKEFRATAVGPLGSCTIRLAVTYELVASGFDELGAMRELASEATGYVTEPMPIAAEGVTLTPPDVHHPAIRLNPPRWLRSAP